MLCNDERINCFRARLACAGHGDASAKTGFGVAFAVNDYKLVHVSERPQKYERSVNSGSGAI